MPEEATRFLDRLYDDSVGEYSPMIEGRLGEQLSISMALLKPKEIPDFSFYGYKKQVEAGIGIGLHSIERCGKTLLVFGYPGTGKTIFPCAVANKLNATLKEKVSLAYIRFDGVETVEKNEFPDRLDKLFQKMRKNPPTILHIIALDTLGRPFERLSESSRYSFVDPTPKLLRYTLSRKAIEMKNTLVICTVNYPKNMDTSFLHRFNGMFYFEPMDKQVIVDAVTKLLGRTDSEEVATGFIQRMSEKLVPLSGNIVGACKLISTQAPDVKELETPEVVDLLIRSLSLSTPIDVVSNYEANHAPFIKMSYEHVKFWRKAYLDWSKHRTAARVESTNRR